jgi:hypothetical protein
MIFGMSNVLRMKGKQERAREETAMGQRPEHPSTQGAWADQYRDKWKWDKVTWGSHCVDCYPTNCPYRVYSRNGRVIREEPSGHFGTVEKDVPDMNPAGCQKGASWSQMLDGKERILHPLRRAGERGEGRWNRVSWDEALTEIADAMLDAIEESGPQSIVRIGTPGEGGTQTMILGGGVFQRIGATSTDVQSEINDFNPGLYITFGRFDPAHSNDDWFRSELLLIWANNPAYGSIPWYHFLAEARYNGSEVVTIAPDYSPSAIHGDYFVPVRIGSDAALALSMCRVIIDEELVDKASLPAAVRRGGGGSRQHLLHVRHPRGPDRRSASHSRSRRAGAGSRRKLPRHLDRRRRGGGATGVRAPAASPRGLRARGRVGDLRRKPRGDPRPRSQGRASPHDDPHGVDARQVVPRRSDGKGHLFAAWPHRKLG